jgi:hypothetical protein
MTKACGEFGKLDEPEKGKTQKNLEMESRDWRLEGAVRLAASEVLLVKKERSFDSAYP